MFVSRRIKNNDVGLEIVERWSLGRSGLFSLLSREKADFRNLPLGLIMKCVDFENGGNGIDPGLRVCCSYY